MKVIHIITDLDNGGGAQAVLRNLITTDQENNHQVILLMDMDKNMGRVVNAKVLVYTLNMPRGQVTLKGLIELYRLIRTINPDVVQTWMYHADLVGGIVARLAGVRAVVWGIHHSNLDPDRTSRSTRWVALICAHFSRLLPRRIVSSSERAERVHIDLGYNQNKVVLIQNGYNLIDFAIDTISRVRLRFEWSIDSKTVLLGMVARWDPHKDHANLFAALKQLKLRNVIDFNCVLVGSHMTEQNAQLVDLLVHYGVRDCVQLKGSRDDIPAVMNALDLHVLSSISESFPNVVAEAMACGTPCVVTDVGDAAYMVGETGWVVPSGEPVLLANAMQVAISALFEDEQWRMERQPAVRERIEANFGIERMVQSYNAVWNTVVL